MLFKGLLTHKIRFKKKKKKPTIMHKKHILQPNISKIQYIQPNTSKVQYTITKYKYRRQIHLAKELN